MGMSPVRVKNNDSFLPSRIAAFKFLTLTHSLKQLYIVTYCAYTCNLITETKPYKVVHTDSFLQVYAIFFNAGYIP